MCVCVASRGLWKGLTNSKVFCSELCLGLSWYLSIHFLCMCIYLSISLVIFQGGRDIGPLITMVPNVLSPKLWILLFKSNSSLQTLQAIILVCRRGDFVSHHWEWISIYCLLSFPLRSLLFRTLSIYVKLYLSLSFSEEFYDWKSVFYF